MAASEALVFPSSRIRRASSADLPQLVLMGSRFFDESGYSDVTSLDPESVITTLTGMIENSDAVLLVVESGNELIGMAGALIYPFYFNLQHRTSQEIFWWVDPEHRGIGGRLFDAMRDEIKAKGAQSLSMIALESLNPDGVGAYYRRKGLRPSERSFIGRI